MMYVEHPRFRGFVRELESLLNTGAQEPQILTQGKALLQSLIATDDWLPSEFALPNAKHYRQYLLHLDPQERFSVVSFVWGPGQTTPIHNHTVWGLIGMLRGAEFSQSFVRSAEGGLVEDGQPVRLEPGAVEAVSPDIGDLHAVSNAFTDRVSISIHVYGANIGKVDRFVFQRDGTTKTFVSGYSNV